MIDHIDLDSLIAAKNPRLAQRMPRFIKAYLRRILHLKELNSFLAEHHDTYGFAFAEAGMAFVDLKLDTAGEEHLSAADRPLCVANHPLGGLEGVALLTLIGKHHGRAKLLVNDFLMALENLGELFVPVNKHGSNRKYKTGLDRAAASDDPLIIFPAGLCSRKHPHGIYDLEWNKSFIKMARENRRPVIPVYVCGRNSRFFYSFAALRRKLGIKANIEMLFLVNEMMKQRHLTLKIVIGEPIPWETFTAEYSDWEWARRLRDFVYTMSDGRPGVFDAQRAPVLPETYYG
jgi:putative hemolysin